MLVVTGAGGRVGNVVVRELLRRWPDRPVRVMLLPGEPTRAVDGLPVEIVRADVTDRASLDAAFAGAEGVLHVAGYVSLAGDWERLRAINDEGVGNVLAAAIAAGASRVVHVASTHALAEPDTDIVMDETHPIDPERALGAYGKTKALGARRTLAAAAAGQIEAMVVCPSGILGPWDFGPSHQGQLLVDAVDRPAVMHCGGGYDFTDVRDVAGGVVSAFERGRSGEHYILSGEQVELRDMIAMSTDVLGRRGRQVQIPRAVAMAAAHVAPWIDRMLGRRPRFTAEAVDVVFGASRFSHAKASRELGYQHRPLRETILDQMQWFAAEGYLRRVRPVPVVTAAAAT